MNRNIARARNGQALMAAKTQRGNAELGHDTRVANSAPGHDADCNNNKRKIDVFSPGSELGKINTIIADYESAKSLISDPDILSNVMSVPIVEATVSAVLHTLQKHIEIFEECHDQDTQVRILGRRLKARLLTIVDSPCSSTPSPHMFD